MDFKITYSIQDFRGIMRFGVFSVEAANLDIVQEKAFELVLEQVKESEIEMIKEMKRIKTISITITQL